MGKVGDLSVNIQVENIEEVKEKIEQLSSAIKELQQAIDSSPIVKEMLEKEIKLQQLRRLVNENADSEETIKISYQAESKRESDFEREKRAARMVYAELPLFIQTILSKTVTVPIKMSFLEIRASEIQRVVEETIKAQLSLYRDGIKKD